MKEEMIINHATVMNLTWILRLSKYNYETNVSVKGRKEISENTMSCEEKLVKSCFVQNAAYCSIGGSRYSRHRKLSVFSFHSRTSTAAGFLGEVSTSAHTRRVIIRKVRRRGIYFSLVELVCHWLSAFSLVSSALP